jgi:hypothetical protein
VVDPFNVKVALPALAFEMNKMLPAPWSGAVAELHEGGIAGARVSVERHVAPFPACDLRFIDGYGGVSHIGVLVEDYRAATIPIGEGTAEDDVGRAGGGGVVKVNDALTCRGPAESREGNVIARAGTVQKRDCPAIATWLIGGQTLRHPRIINDPVSADV